VTSVTGMSGLLPSGSRVEVGGEQVAHAGDAVAPQQFEPVQSVVGGTQGRDVSGHQVLPALALFGHQSRPLQDRDVLLHGGEAHRVVAGQGGDRERVVNRAPHDVPPRGVGEGLEEPIHLDLTYNHTVVYSTQTRPDARGSAEMTWRRLTRRLGSAKTLRRDRVA